MTLQDLLQDAIAKGEGGLYIIPEPSPQLPGDMEIRTMHPLVYQALLMLKHNKK